jgi:hypothetical protein
VSPLGDVTDADRLRWQHRAASVLVQLLQRAQAEQLPLVRWTVHTHGASLVGATTSRTGWQTWVEALHFDNVWPERQHGGGVHLHAVGGVRSDTGLHIHIALVADIDLDSEGDGA